MKNNLFDRDTLLHLRLPFSFFLLPVFCFAISQSAPINWLHASVIFVVLHLFIYPGSNIYNSYMDEDKGSIGGLKNPPPVTKKLFYASILVDSVGLSLCLLINYRIFLLMLFYVAISKAYSWKKIRFKKYGLTGWLVVMFFQGGYTFLMVNMAVTGVYDENALTLKNVVSMIIASLLIGAMYPLTQVYQHEEDSARGDMTISYKLGTKGTFIFTGILFLLASILSWKYFQTFASIKHFKIFMVCLLPAIGYYFFWCSKVWRDKNFADYSRAMRMTFISSLFMIICFTLLFFMDH